MEKVDHKVLTKKTEASHLHGKTLLVELSTYSPVLMLTLKQASSLS